MISIPATGATVSDISDDTAIQGITGGSNTGFDTNFYVNPASSGTGGWVTPANISTAWGDGLGAIVYFYNNTSSGSSVLPLDLDVSGTEPISDVAVTLTNDVTLAGNPFQSNINIDDISGDVAGVGILFGGLKSTVKVWDNSGSYVSYNLGTNQVLSEWQGFFVEISDGLLSDPTQLTIPASSKTGSAATISHFSKQTSASTYEYGSIDLKLTAGEFI